MASTPLGDIPNARHDAKPTTFAAVASNGAEALIGGPYGPYEHPIKVTNVYYTPTGGDSNAEAASYRRISLVNLGTAGAGTTVVASINLSATHASLAGAAGAVTANNTVPAGATLFFSQGTVGGEHDAGTALIAGGLHFSYEVI